MSRGVALRAASGHGTETCVVVDHVGALIRCESQEIEPLPRAVAQLAELYCGVWRDIRASEYLFCVRPCAELPIGSHRWKRLVRAAALAPPSVVRRSGSTA